MMHIKESAYQFCEAYIQERITRLKAQMTNLKVGLGSETKSSAGDKHETGRAMVQLEMEKLGKQLLEAEKLVQTLQKVPKEGSTLRVALGSLVATDKHTYYIAISAGRHQLDGHIIFCISASTPIAKLLLGKEKGAAIVFNGLHQNITEIH